MGARTNFVSSATRPCGIALWMLESFTGNRMKQCPECEERPQIACIQCYGSGKRARRPGKPCQYCDGNGRQDCPGVVEERARCQETRELGRHTRFFVRCIEGAHPDSPTIGYGPVTPSRRITGTGIPYRSVQ